MIMLLFASVRVDLNANLFVDEHGLSNEEKENHELQWRDLGFPIGIRRKLRAALLKAPKRGVKVGRSNRRLPRELVRQPSVPPSA
jgi:hypothetical protein